MRARSKLAVAFLGGLAAGMFACGTAIADEPAAGAESGVWQRHEFSFEFMGFTSTYSCDGLADKLRLLLLLAGARADAQARPGACANGFGRPDRFARASLVFYTLAPGVAGSADGEPGMGQWRPVALGIRQPFDLLAGDCELVEQFRDAVLKKMFAIRNLTDNVTCVPHQESGTVFDVRFETFAQAPDAAGPVAAQSQPQVFAYPRHGQTATQQSKDRSECEASARRGAESAAAAGAPVAPSDDAYAKALAACLEGRGYSVR